MAHENAAPEGYHTLTPSLTVDGAARLIDFLERAFDARPVTGHIMHRDDGSIMHAEVVIGDSRVMLSDATEEWPKTTSSFYVYVADCDAVHRQAVAAGGKSILEPEDMPYGDRHGGVVDPAGNQWWIATPVAKPVSA
jgi:PhnB protein